ncbi:hypothetical protein [Vibrio owensii]|uniref:hypothetical protein n=1 Tax=Vibrio harveyi group TaxID=717610 RepID=UPI003CC64F3F
MSKTYSPSEKAASKINNAILTAKKLGSDSKFKSNLSHLVVACMLEATQYRAITYDDQMRLEKALSSITGNQDTLNYLSLVLGHYERHGTIVDVASVDTCTLLYQLYLEAEFQYKASSMQTNTKNTQLFRQVFELSKVVDDNEFMEFYKAKRIGFLSH